MGKFVFHPISRFGYEGNYKNVKSLFVLIKSIFIRIFIFIIMKY